MTKPDVLSGFETIKVCTHYEIDGKRIDYMPTRSCMPIYARFTKEFPGWKKTLPASPGSQEFPKELSDYIAWIEENLNVRVYRVRRP